ncbi:ABC transporter permease [Chitinispirillales bacterium ANBcel5]|uniref:ABC transporter permease n=1 Tax=Cellulosispirillum alkaliphilum TaxID=3039283 RepID=UPI002A56F6F2|nr:ABC transporter permease [Chitinispirillales bacterium ANBcel5]
MPSSNNRLYPSLAIRILSVWYRHFRVYTKNIISNGLPPFLEPLIFLVGLGIGLDRYVTEMSGLPYLIFLATGLPLTTAMYTAAFECSYGTFIRYEFEKVYDGMLAAPLSVCDLLLGEVLWAGTKGFFFSLAVILVLSVFGLMPYPGVLFTPVVGFLTGVLFASTSLLITSFVSNINHFNFYFTGVLSPMFFFSGVIFPLENLPRVVQYFAELLPLTHAVRLARNLNFANYEPVIIWDIAFIILFTFIAGYFGIGRLKRKLIH